MTIKNSAIRSIPVLLALLLSGSLLRVSAQPPASSKYVIFTFEDTYKISGGLTKRYYWIIAQDSIKSIDNHVLYLFLDGFSKNNLTDCCNGKDIDPTTEFQNTSFDFTRDYSKGLDELDTLMLKNRKELQTVTKTWSLGQVEEIKVFATAITGKFCSSNFHKFGKKISDYKGKVYIPYSSFSYAEGFWESDKAKFILHQDFSEVSFKKIPF
jgi:hypothetical protein